MIGRGKVVPSKTNSLSAAAPAAGSFHLPTEERSKDMFTRVVEMTSKSGKSQELANTINEKAVPILKKQRGFVDEIVLVSSAESDRVLALSFWKKKEDAEEYQREQYQKIHDTLRHLLQTEPTIRTFDVHTSIAHKVTAKQAA
jgi:heme-degrading monooxygenase HmoA